MEAVGKVDAQFLTTDIVKENRSLKPEPSIIPVGKNTKQLAIKLAEKVAAEVDKLLEENMERDD